MLRRNLNSQFIASHQVGSSANAFFRSKHASQAEQIFPNLPPLKECLGAIYQALSYKVNALEKNTSAIDAEINQTNKKFKAQKKSALAKLKSVIQQLELEKERANKTIRYGNEAVEYRAPCGYDQGYNSCGYCASGHKETYIRKNVDVELGKAVTKAEEDRKIINNELMRYSHQAERIKFQLIASLDEAICELRNKKGLLNRELNLIGNYKGAILSLLKLINRYDRGKISISKSPMGKLFPEICEEVMLPTELGKSMPTLLRSYFRGNDDALIKIAELFLSMDEINSISSWIKDREQQVREQAQAREICESPAVDLPLSLPVIFSDFPTSAPPLSPISSPRADSLLHSSHFPHIMGLFNQPSNTEQFEAAMPAFPDVPQEEPQQEMTFPEVPKEEPKRGDNTEKPRALSI